MTHDLKSWPANFEALLRGRLFEVRLNDRNFALADFVHLMEFLPAREELTGRTLDFRISDLAPFHLPHERLEPAKHRYLILQYVPVATVQITAATPAPAPLEEKPELELWANVVDTNRVLQVVQDERGEQHQLFGRARSQAAVLGDPGRLQWFRTGLPLRFVRNTCSCANSSGTNTFPVENGACTGCGMPARFQNYSREVNEMVGRTGEEWERKP